MSINGLSGVTGLTRELLETRARLDQLQQQLVTGKRATTYGGLGSTRTLSLSLRQQISAIDSYQSTISQAQLRLGVVVQSLERLQELTAQTRTETLNSEFALVEGGRTQTQLNAAQRLDEAVALLNTDVAGQHFFGGTDTEGSPVLSPEAILNGEGGRAGLIQVVSERKQADLGADGRGRLVVGPAAGATVALAEDADPSPFGLKLTAIQGTLAGTTLSAPSGSPPSLSVTFSSTLPQDGQSARITFALPDGSSEVLELTATSVAPPGGGQFLIGADENATAANFEAALAGAVEGLAATGLAAASAVEAGNNFFDFDNDNPPQRVWGPPFDSATALADATPSDTTLWFRGDAGAGPARNTAIARVDNNLQVAYGIRANEEPLRTSLKAFAVLAAESFNPADPGEETRYKELNQRVTTALNFEDNRKSVLDLIGELGFKQSTLERADERHNSSKLFTQGLIDDNENVDTVEIGVKLLSLQTQLQASYQVTSTLSQLSLVNFL